MPLSYVVEYLLSYFSQTDRVVTYQNSQRINYAGATALPAAVPQPVSVMTDIRTPPNRYAIIIYRVQFSNLIVPNVIQATLLVRGNPIYDDLLGPAQINNPLDCFALVREGLPGQLTLVNNSLLAQNFEAVVSYLTIISAEDFKTALEALQKLPER